MTLQRQRRKSPLAIESIDDRYEIAYTLAIIIPSLYPFYFTWLSSVMSYEYTPVVLLVFGGLERLVRSRHRRPMSLSSMRSLADW